ncbi:hypothetical protein RFI_01738 [Reticulomyxa filosa]|uniref:HECT domain-containing protein n=1 Tax=Reticulomyxa filosa TaxID=46433 RepID=X6PB73_RETFI|nr:hypothetical protein RFI_01738 [Reticulomyxa filosa]|eukprot:ETO35324.1 hypothetical protein RFI_01738 [Reticulomyxa filosa]
MIIFPDLFSHDPDSSRPLTDKELKIEYEIFRNVYDESLHDIRVDILKTRKLVQKSDTQIYIAAEQSTFDRVIEMSLLTLAVHQTLPVENPRHMLTSLASNSASTQPRSTDGNSNRPVRPSSSSSNDLLSVEIARPPKVIKNEGYRLPPLFLGEVARAIQVSDSHYSVVSHLGPVVLTESDECVSGRSCPTGGVGEIHEFTVILWMYLEKKGSENTEMARNIFRKGDRNSNSLLPLICLTGGTKKNTIQVQVTTKGNNRITLTHDGEDIKPRVWRHIAVTGNAIGVKLYVDGKLVQKQRTNGPLKHNSDPIYLGKCPPGVDSTYSTQPTVKSLGVNGSVLDCRYYLRCLQDKAIIRYKSETQMLTKSSVPKIQFQSSRDPDSETKLSLQYFRDVAAYKVPEFDPGRWGSSLGTNLDNEVITMFEACYQQAAMHELREVWKLVAGSANVDANGNPVDNGNEREVRNALRHLSQLNIVAHSLNPDSKLLERHDALSDIDLQTLKRRFFMLQMLNHKMKTIFPLVDFTQVGLSWSLASRLCGLRSLIFTDLKRQPWQNVLQQTSSNHRTSVLVNRLKALRTRERASTNALNAIEAAKKSVFGQVYRILNFVKPVYLRCSANQRPWSIVYEGEGGTDAGGLFRDSLSAICADLQSDYLPLFVKCPNSRGYGDNQEKWIPNPVCTSSLQLSMYTFVGKLMGTAIRGNTISTWTYRQLCGNR